MLLRTFIVMHAYICRVKRGVASFSDTEDFFELTYELLRGDFDYNYSSGESACCVKLKAYWVKITCKSFADTKLIEEKAALEGPVSTNLQKAREFCQYLCHHRVFPEHLVSIIEDCIINISGGLEYSIDFDRAAAAALDTVRLRPNFVRQRSQM